MPKKVVLSAGHSTSDSGAVNTQLEPDLKENFLTMDLVKLCVPILRSQGITVATISDDISLLDTINKINKDYPTYDLAVELHINAGGGTGVEGWYYQNDEVSKKLSDDILNGIVSETGMKSRGSKDESTNRHGRLGFVHDTKPLACLIECGFIDSIEDLKLLATEAGRYKIAKGVARGICANLGVTFSDSDIPEDPCVAMSEALKQALKDVEAEKEKKVSARNERDAIKKDFEKFKNEEYKRAVDLANTMEGKYNDKVIEFNTFKLNEHKPVLDKLKDYDEVKIPELKKNASDATTALQVANEKIDRLLSQNFTLPEIVHFLVRYISKNKGGVVSGNDSTNKPN